MYRPPKGRHILLNNYLENIFKNLKTEILLLGDMNVDLLNPNDDNKVKYLLLFKKYCLRQYTDDITRPNTHGGTYIHKVVSNSEFVKKTGVYAQPRTHHLQLANSPTRPPRPVNPPSLQTAPRACQQPPRPALSGKKHKLLGEYHVTIRCYVQRFLSDTSFADFADDFNKLEPFSKYKACRLSNLIIMVLL